MKEGELGRVYSNGEAICREGDPGDVMFVIQSGRVKITKHTPSGEITLATLGSGDMFGEMALFDKLPRSATATALGESRVLSIDKKKLFLTITRDPTLVFKILDTMSQRIRRMNENIAQLSEAKAKMLDVICNREDVCRMILTEAGNIVKAENGSIMLYDKNTKILSIVAAFGVESDEKLTFAVGEGIAGNVLMSGRAELVNNVAIDSRYKAGEMKIRSLLCVPFKCDDDQLGIINMSVNTDRLFTVDDLKALNSFAPYASMAIMTAKNFSGLRHAADNILIHATLLNV